MRFHVENMTCGHCERRIRTAIAALSPETTVAIDLQTRHVDIDGPLTEAQVVAALAEESYRAVPAGETA